MKDDLHSNILRHRKNVFSQNGEDGVIEELFRRLGILQDQNSWVCEVGAWDGKYLSNTFNLVSKYGCKAVMIEADREKFSLLLKTSEDNPSVIPILAKVGYRPDEESLDDILERVGNPKFFALLSIDIDSDNLLVWYSLTIFRPKIVVIEINPDYPPGIVFFHGGRFMQNTFSAAVNVATLLNYTLVSSKL